MENATFQQLPVTKSHAFPFSSLLLSGSRHILSNLFFKVERRVPRSPVPDANDRTHLLTTMEMEVNRPFESSNLAE